MFNKQSGFVLKVLALLLAFCMILIGCSKENNAKETSKNVEEQSLKITINGVDEARTDKIMVSLSDKRKAMVDFDYDNLYANAFLEVSLGEKFSDYIDLLSGSSVSKIIEAIGLKSAKISADLNVNDDICSFDAAGYINDKRILHGGTVFNADSSKLYLSPNSLAESTASVDLNAAVEGYSEVSGGFFKLFTAQQEAYAELFEGVNKALSEDELIEIVSDYSDAVESVLDKPETGSTVISVDGIEEKVITEEYVIDAECAKKVSKVVLTKLKDDKVIRDKFMTIYPMFVEYVTSSVSGMIVEEFADIPTAEELYDETLIPEIDNILSNLDEMFDSDDDSKVTFTAYLVDDAFAGCRISKCDDNDDTLDYNDYYVNLYIVEEKNNSGISLSFADMETDTQFKVVGNENEGFYNGTVTVTADGEDVIFYIENLDLNKLEEGVADFSVAFYNKDFEPFTEFELPDGFAVKLKVFSDYESEASVTVVAQDEGVEIIKAVLAFVYNDDAHKIDLPEEDTSFTNFDDAGKWFLDIVSGGVPAIIENLDEAGISTDFIKMIIALNGNQN